MAEGKVRGRGDRSGARPPGSVKLLRIARCTGGRARKSARAAIAHTLYAGPVAGIVQASGYLIEII